MSKQNKYNFFQLLFFLLLGMALFVAAPAAAQPAAFYQKGLSPAELHLLFEVQELSHKGEYAKGLQEINEFVKGRQPEADLPPLLGFVAANLNFQLGDYHAAVNFYHRVVEQASEFYIAYENYGMALLQAEDYQAAGRTLLQAAGRLPKKSRKLKYRAAIAFLYGGELEKSRKLLSALTFTADSPGSTVSSPPPADWLKALIQVDWQLADYKVAVAVAEKLVDYYPAEIAFWRLYGQVTLAAGEYRKSLSAYKILQGAGQITLRERKQVAGIYQRLELYQAAAEVLAGVLAEIEPGKTELKQLAALYRQAGQVDKALSTLNRLQKLYPDPMNLLQRGEVLYSVGRYREAFKVFMALGELAEKNGRQYMLAGYSAWNIDDFPAAAGAWQKATAFPAYQKQAADLLQTLQPWLEVKEGSGRGN